MSFSFKEILQASGGNVQIDLMDGASNIHLKKDGGSDMAFASKTIPVLIEKGKENVLGKITKELPLDTYTDGAESRFMVGNQQNCYFAQVSAGAVRTVHENGEYINKPVKIVTQRIGILLTSGDQTNLRTTISQMNGANGYCTADVAKFSISQVVRDFRSYIETRTAAEMINSSDNWSVILDGSVRVPELVAHGLRKDRFFIGITKTSEVSGFPDEARAEIYGLEYGERSSVYRIDDRSPHYTVFLRLRPMVKDNADFGIIQIQIPDFCVGPGWPIGKVYTNICAHIMERSIGIASDMRWDRELKPISDLEKFLKMTFVDKLDFMWHVMRSDNLDF